MVKLTSAALALLLAPAALAQSSVPAAPVEVEEPAPVDSALVGTWELDEMTAPGMLEAYGVEIEAMTCSFSADGEAEIAMTAVQDGDSISRTRAFAFRTEGGEILEEGDAPVAYRFLEDGSLEITDDGMVLRFVRP